MGTVPPAGWTAAVAAPTGLPLLCFFFRISSLGSRLRTTSPFKILIPVVSFCPAGFGDGGELTAPNRTANPHAKGQGGGPVPGRTARWLQGSCQVSALGASRALRPLWGIVGDGMQWLACGIACCGKEKKGFVIHDWRREDGVKADAALVGCQLDEPGAAAWEGYLLFWLTASLSCIVDPRFGRIGGFNWRDRGSSKAKKFWPARCQDMAKRTAK